MKKTFFFFLFFLSFSYAKTLEVPIYSYQIEKTYPHDTNNFTQGLFLDDNYLYEGTGLYGRSQVIKSELETGSIINTHKINYFGEGITIIGDNLYQLTYTSNKGFVYDKNTLEQKKVFFYPTQGWGLTTNGTYLIMTDGSNALHFFNPSSFIEEKTILCNK